MGFGAKAQSSGLSMKACVEVMIVVKMWSMFTRVRRMVVMAAVWSQGRMAARRDGDVC